MLIIAVLCALALGIVVPFAAIWSLNTLLMLGIEYSIRTWFAALILIGVTQGKALPSISIKRSEV